MSKRKMEVLEPQMYYVLWALYKLRHGYEMMNEISRLTYREIRVGARTLLPKFEKEYYLRLVKKI